MTSSSSSVPPLDFEKLLSREYRPARVSRLIPREAYRPEQQQQQQQQQQSQQHHKEHDRQRIMLHPGGKKDGDVETQQQRFQQKQRHETSRLVLSLVSQTPNFTKHVTQNANSLHNSNITRQQLLKQYQPKMAPTTNADAMGAIVHVVGVAATNKNNRIPPKFHEIELGDWESKIDWGDGRQNSIKHSHETVSSSSTLQSTAVNENDHHPRRRHRDPLELLQRRRNPFLDALKLDETTVCWGDGEDAQLLQRKLLQKAKQAPLILELGVAGQSVARHVYQNTVLSAQRPTAALQSEAYQDRLDRDWSKHGGAHPPPQSSSAAAAAAATTAKGALHADKDKMEALIEARQRKRAQMAKDKTSRVTQAMGTLALGGGRGRTITSSLMGPGGTERTGRPSRHNVGLAGYESEYIEQLDLVVTHALVRDLSRILLREFHRPKLPLNVVRLGLAWQFQIRYSPTKKVDGPASGASGVGGSGGGGGVVVAGSYQSVMMGGAHPGAISKAKLRSEADLSPTEGQLILLEYCEERPLLQLSKGMACKIVNYYRGDKARCPVSKGGGDRPARRKRPGELDTGSSGARNKATTRREVPCMVGPRETNIMDWVGKLPKKQKDRTEKEAIDVLPEGVTEILHPKVHGPFLGEIEEGMTLTGLISNLFVAPMFRHEPEQTDFLMILTPPGGAARAGHREMMGVVLRDLPTSVFTVGQVEPRTRVYAPNTQGEKNFVGPFISYQIAKALTKTEAREGHGLRFDELQDRVLPNLELPANALRQRLKLVAMYDKNTQIWTTKAIGYEDYPGVDALGKSISPESVAAFETAQAATRRLADLGIHHLCTGSHTVASVGVTMVYLAGQVNATRELARKAKKLLELSRINRSIAPEQIKFYEKSAEQLDAVFKVQRQKYEVAQFIYEELQLTPWHLSGEFIDVHKKGEGTGMLKLTGLGDPSGTGEGFSFLREVEKPAKSVGPNPALNNQIKKITGTEDDLRKLTMKQMASLLRSYGMAQKQIDTLKRWDRVHVIRDLSTKAASDGMGDGLERFARGEKMKLSEQKQMYRDRVQTIWGREIAALSSDAGEKGGISGHDTAISAVDGEVDGVGGQSKKADLDKDSSDDSDSDDDLAAALEDEMMDRAEANQLVAAHAIGGAEGVGLGKQFRAAVQDHDLSKDARELAALKRQREEERAAQEGFQTIRPRDDRIDSLPGVRRKVIKKIIRKTHPDGRQTTTFKFILHPEEVGKIMARKATEEERPRLSDMKYDYSHVPEEKLPGHSMFEDDDDYDRLMSNRRRAMNKKNRSPGAKIVPPSRPRNLQIGKLKTKISKEERMRKRKREEEEREVYVPTAKLKGANNRRRERGSIRERRPHVMFAEKLESIRASVETRPSAGPFLKPVNRKLLPVYYEIISHPIDLSTIRDKISRYEYRTADSFVRDFELMKTNAIKFNGQGSQIADEAVAIHDFIRHQVDSCRAELKALEEQVEELMNAKPKKKNKPGASKSSGIVSGSNVARVGGISVNLGDLSKNMAFGGGVDSDSDESIEI